MRLLDIDHLPADLRDPVLVVALDGWTDAGTAGTRAAELLMDAWPSELFARFDPDEVFDYRDRRPRLTIDEGVLGDPEWPALDLHALRTDDGPDLIVLTGGEPDFRWRALCRDLAELVDELGVASYVGLGSVPGPAPHTRPIRVIATSDDTDVLEQIGRPHERVVVPASCQVVIETALRDEGLATLGLWARIPHYVAGEYPAGTRALLDRFGPHLGLVIDTAQLLDEIEETQQRLDEAASQSPEVQAHIAQLEKLYDSEDDFSGPLPTGDQIAADFERFLRGRDD